MLAQYTSILQIWAYLTDKALITKYLDLPLIEMSGDHLISRLFCTAEQDYKKTLSIRKGLIQAKKWTFLFTLKLIQIVTLNYSIPLISFLLTEKRFSITLTVFFVLFIITVFFCITNTFFFMLSFFSNSP